MPEIVAVLDNIRSVHNVGSIFRTSDGAGIAKIHLCGITPTPLDKFGRVRRDFRKVSLGSEKWVEWERHASAVRCLKRLKRDGYKILAVEQAEDSIPYSGAKKSFPGRKEKLALVFGNEVSGVSAAALGCADKVLEIPMRGALSRETGHPGNLGEGKESLNVAVAFGIVAYRLCSGVK